MEDRRQPVKVLFVCSRNQWRSPTAERVAREWPSVEARSAGMSPNATCTLNERHLRWADIVIVMEKKHRERIVARFPAMLRKDQIHVLNIPDDYQFMDPELVDWIEAAVPPLLDYYKFLR
jgi:predicted protein tyrosine phosphatase